MPHIIKRPGRPADLLVGVYGLYELDMETGIAKICKWPTREVIERKYEGSKQTQLARWLRGDGLIQDILTDFSVEERELFLSGMDEDTFPTKG